MDKEAIIYFKDSHSALEFAREKYFQEQVNYIGVVMSHGLTKEKHGVDAYSVRVANDKPKFMQETAIVLDRTYLSSIAVGDLVAMFVVTDPELLKKFNLHDCLERLYVIEAKLELNYSLSKKVWVQDVTPSEYLAAILHEKIKKVMK
jgi:hypothetical protein